jgi:caa(3)-type oxidase subunit IV
VKRLKDILFVGVWGYLVLATAVEVEAYYALASHGLVLLVIGVLAASQAMSIALFFMHLREEPNSLKLFALIPIMFLAALLVTLVASLG